MERGDFYEATAAGASDLYYVDAGLYGTPGYGSIYVLDAERPAVIETGTGYSYELLLETIERVGIDPEELEVIAVTHVHLDHAGGAGLLAEACPNADVYVHGRGAPHVVGHHLERIASRRFLLFGLEVGRQIVAVEARRLRIG